jgi:C-terminal processing protease CtpA/Prc
MSWRTVNEWQVVPCGAAYDGPVVLLIDVSNASSAEDFIVSMADSGRAGTVGRATGGMSGNPVNFSLPGGGEARFSTGDIRRMNGRRIEGAGVTPDVPVAWTVDDFRAGRDPDVAAAVALLQSAAP